MWAWLIFLVIDVYCVITIVQFHELIEAEWRICVSKLTHPIGSDNGLLPGRLWAIIWTNAAIYYCAFEPYEQISMKTSYAKFSPKYFTNIP